MPSKYEATTGLLLRGEDEIDVSSRKSSGRRKTANRGVQRGSEFGRVFAPYGHDQLAEMQKIIDAEASDLFDVLAYVAFAMTPVTREVRAASARVQLINQFSDKQQAFLDFVLQHYVTVGVEELDLEKLTPLLRLKYHDSIADAVAQLGQPEEIGRMFTAFQKYLYLKAG